MENSLDFSRQLLFYSPMPEDSYFSDALIYICRHDSQGAFGLMLNRETPLTLELLKDQFNVELPATGTRLREGGPVSRETLLILYESERDLASSLRVAPSLAVTSSPDFFPMLAEQGEDCRYLFFLGYAGWGPGQLDNEFGNNVWINTPGDLSIVFDTPPGQQVSRISKQLGFDLRAVSNSPGCA